MSLVWNLKEYIKKLLTFNFLIFSLIFGGLAQLARAPALHAGGQRFESVILHILIRNSEF